MLSSFIGSALVLLCLRGVLTGSPLQASADYAHAFELAQAELQAGNASAAKSLIQTLLANQDRPELHNLLGDCEEALGNFREAANQYQIAARADPSEPNVYSFGSELLKLGAYPEAIQIFSYGAAHYSQSARIRVGLGIAQYSVGNYREAVATLCGAVDINRSDPRAFEFLGKMIGIAPDLSKEVSARLKEFAANYPDNPAANYYYAMALLDGPNPAHESARRLLQLAVSESPSFAEAHYQLGIAYDQEGDAARAIAELQAAVRLKPDWKKAHYRLAQIYRASGQTALAKREYQAVKNTPGR